MFSRAEQRIVVFKKNFGTSSLFIYFPSGSNDHFWNFPREQLGQISSVMESGLLVGW